MMSGHRAVGVGMFSSPWRDAVVLGSLDEDKRRHRKPTGEAGRAVRASEAGSDFESRKKVWNKNRIIDELEKSRVPCQGARHVSQSLAPLKVWLVRVASAGKNDLRVVRSTNDDVVEFVNTCAVPTISRISIFKKVELRWRANSISISLNLVPSQG